jgi:1-deoxy-D-xylulose-5-phosphate reductoisomerase
MKRLAILGSTGSIGKSTLQIVSHHREEFEVVALAAHSNAALLAEQIRSFRPKRVALYEKQKAIELREMCGSKPILYGEEGLEEVATFADADLVVMAIVGLNALGPTVAALRAGKAVALASKEVLVAAGGLIKRLAKEANVPLLPIDSEHSAIFQCIDGKKQSEIERVILTASGGPFFSLPLEKMEEISVEEALCHPTWRMGPKVTIDCSTLMNKGLEMIEARWMFDLAPEKIEIVIHPQSLIHSFIEWIDGTLMAQMSEPNMIYPIQYALTYPQRRQGFLPRFDFSKNGKLEFHPYDSKKFPAINLAQEALKVGESLPPFLNGANEMLVERFIKKEISWLDIIKRLEKLMARHAVSSISSIEDVFQVDQQARKEASAI